MPDTAAAMAHTPGVYFALAYWMACVFFICPNPHRIKGWKLLTVMGTYLLAIVGFMHLTDGVSVEWFFPCMFVTVSMMLLCIKSCCRISWTKAGYFCVRAFTLGEFAASLEWQLYYFGVTVLKMTRGFWVSSAFVLISHGAVFGAMYFLERKQRPHYERLQIGMKELQTAAFICFSVFAVSNLSYAFDRTPFSSQFTAEIFIIRTFVDLGGLGMLYAYHAQLQDMNSRMEIEFLKNLLHLQYENYKFSAESIALVDRKYHDLKHQIQLLRSEVESDEKMRYLDQMEQEIRSYEAQNKTGNRVLDTMLSAKSMQCRELGVSLTCVADGQELNFLHPMDLSALLGNALDNAIEAACKLSDPEKRLIHLSVARQKGFLRIRVENCYEGELRYQNGMPATTKQDKQYHGFGLRSIQSIVEKYNGSMTINAKGEWFELRVLFPVPNNTREADADKE